MPTSAVLGRLAAALDELPQRATLAAWGLAWQKLARYVGLLPAIESDEAAWHCLGEALRESDTLFQWLGQRLARVGPPRRTGGASGCRPEPAARVGRRRVGPRAGALGPKRPGLEGAISVPGRAVRKGISLAAGRRPPLQRGRLPAADRARAAAGRPPGAKCRGDAALLRGRHPGDAAAVAELSGPGRGGPAVVAQPIFARGRTGLRSGPNRPHASRPI